MTGPEHYREAERLAMSATTCDRCVQRVEYVGGAWRSSHYGATCPMGGRHQVDPAPVDWPARFRAAAEVAGTGFVPGEFLNLADDLEHLPPDVVEAIGRALTGEGAELLAAVVDLRARYARARAELAALRGMEQRARDIVEHEDSHRTTTARYILGEAL